jgi:hypothetical protein
MYSITIQYQTGTDCSSYSKTEDNFATFPTLEEAKEFLRTLKAHYCFVQELDSILFKSHPKATPQQIKDKYYNEPWFDKTKTYATQHYFIFKDTTYELPYVGYFETLHRAEIVFPIEDGICFEPNELKV